MVPQQEMPQKNTSGMGDASVIPPGVKGWSWGAFLLNWIWGIGNDVYIALLSLVPFVNVVMMFFLGFKGREWAWRKRRWESVEEFNRVQRKWSIVALCIMTIPFLLVIGVLVLALTGTFFGGAKEVALATLRQNPQAVELLGEPIELGWSGGRVSTVNGNSCALLTIPVNGSKSSGSINFVAVGQGDKWLVIQEILTAGDQRIAIVNRPDKDQFMIELNSCLKDKD